MNARVVAAEENQFLKKAEEYGFVRATWGRAVEEFKEEMANIATEGSEERRSYDKHAEGNILADLLILCVLVVAESSLTLTN